MLCICTFLAAGDVIIIVAGVASGVTGFLNA